MTPRARVGSLEGAAAFVEEVGLALLFPSVDLVLPSLWEAIAGSRPVDWSVRDEEGGFVSFTPEFDSIWRWKDELPERRLVCAGRHLGRSASLVSPGLLGELYALTGRAGAPDDFRDADLSALELEVADAVLENGPCTTPEVRLLLGTTEKRRIDAAVASLQRQLVLTNAGVSEQEHGWPAIRLDVLARRWRPALRRVPPPDAALTRLAETVLCSAGEVSAADLRAVLGCRLVEARAALEALAEDGRAVVRSEDGVPLWSGRAPAA